jgi:hypothetical protein
VKVGNDFLPVGIIDDMVSVVFAQEKKWGWVGTGIGGG